MHEIRQGYDLSENRACGLVGITRWINRYESRRDSQGELRQRIRELAGARPRYGYRRLTVLLRREGWKVNAKRVYRIYRGAISGCEPRSETRRPLKPVSRFPSQREPLSVGVWIL